MELLKNKIELCKQDVQGLKLVLEAKVSAGLEKFAVREIRNKLRVKKDAIFRRNESVYFCCTTDEFRKVQLLRTVESINLLVDVVLEMRFTGNKENDLNELIQLGMETDFLPSLRNWEKLSQFKRGGSSETVSITDDKIRFRVTCNRTVRKIGSHSFNRRNAEAKFGGALYDKFQWTVSLNNWQLNVLLDIIDDVVIIGFHINKQALEEYQMRNSIDLGSTALKPELAYSMLALAKIRPEDHVVDVLCDSGSLTIECLYAFKDIRLTSGDLRYKKSFQTLENVVAQPVDLRIPGVFIWEKLLFLPFRNNTVDVLLLNMASSRLFNDRYSFAYTIINRELARVLREESGRIVVLTKDIISLFQTCRFGEPDCFWRISKSYNFSMRNVNYTIIVAFRRNA